MANGGTITWGPVLAVVLALFAGFAAVVVWLGQVGSWRDVLTAAVRAAVQLAVVSLLITAVLASGWLTALFVVMMFAIASVTSGRRVGRWADAVWTALSLAAGVVPVLAALLGSGLVPLTTISVVPIAGIVIGGAMTATSPADGLWTSCAPARVSTRPPSRWGSSRDAALLVCRPSAGQALVPALDQTRTVGLVTLPGAFVGVLLGGASPIQAGVTQLVVLVSLLLAEAIAVVVTVELVAAGRFGTAAHPA
ncbi:ABC transporter permease [Kibdelosporangium lantanae]